MIVVPALLETEDETLVASVRRLSPYFTRFQIDIADGRFVPNTTVSVSAFTKLCPQLPNGLKYDFHLMVESPNEHIGVILSASHFPIGTVLIHKSVFPDLQQLSADYPNLNVGLVLNPEDSVESIDGKLLKCIGSVQIMTVVPGFQGQSFLPDMLIKIEQLKKRGFLGEILIDGSVNDATIPLITKLASSPDVLGVGSYLTRAGDDDLPRRVRFLQSQLIPGNKSNKK